MRGYGWSCGVPFLSSSAPALLPVESPFLLIGITSRNEAENTWHPRTQEDSKIAASRRLTNCMISLLPCAQDQRPPEDHLLDLFDCHSVPGDMIFAVRLDDEFIDEHFFRAFPTLLASL
jgi:hypothetical protein